MHNELIDALELLVRPATLIQLRQKEVAQTSSKSGGTPYFEANKIWPAMDNGKPLQFIFQINTKQLKHLSNGKTRLIQLFVRTLNGDYHESDGWHVRVYADPKTSRNIDIDIPGGALPSLSSSIHAKQIKQLPDWVGIERYNNVVPEICATMSDRPWKVYSEVVGKLTDLPRSKTFIGKSFSGGYPQWLQGDQTPDCKICGRTMSIFMQIDSNMGFSFGDMGVAYLFNCPSHESEFEFVVQSH